MKRVHYILSNSADSPIRYELQARTLIDKERGDFDHRMNYLHPTDKLWVVTAAAV